MDIPDSGFTQSEDIPDSGSHALEGDGFDEGASEVRAGVGERWEEGEGRLNFAELCREFGISRQVGYVWLRRYRQAKHDLSALEERARRPLTSPTKLADAMEDLLVAARKQH
jgi:hypothetical protein